MNSLSKPQKFFSEFDMFAAPPLLRARKSNCTSSYMSGMLSALLGVFFIYIFVAKIINVTNFESINSTQTDSKLSAEQARADNLFFSVRVDDITIEEFEELFQYQLKAFNDEGDRVVVPMKRCSQDQLEILGPTYKQDFVEYEYDTSYCPINSTMLRIRKTFYSMDAWYITVALRPCSISQTCIQNKTEHYRRMKLIEQKEGLIFLLVYFFDSMISPSERFPISKTINTNSQFAFTLKRGIIGTIELSSYKISTDVSFLPYQQTQIIKGSFWSNFRETSYEIVNNTQNYGLIYICMNRDLLIIERAAGKFDETISYAGGLVSLIIGFLNIFIYSYNEYRYQLMVAEGICQTDEYGNKIHEKELSLFKYVKYVFFDWIRLVFCFDLKWEDCILIDKAREQANSLLDVTNLFKKIKSFENCIKHMLDENQKDCMFLMKPSTLDESKRDRLILEYYSTIMQDDSPMTILEYKNAQILLKFAIYIQETEFRRIKRFKSSHRLQSITQIYQGPPSYEQPATDEVLALFPDILNTVCNIKLAPEMEQVEKQLVDAYSKLTEEQLNRLEDVIPIKILIRLRLKKVKRSNFPYENYSANLESLIKLESMQLSDL